jgi:hypothetical protein
MQPPTDTIRGATTAQVIALLQDAPDIRQQAGLELVDLDLNCLEDLADDLWGGEISRDSYADLHGHAQFTLAPWRELDWGAALVRPYLRLTGTTRTGVVSARFNLGVYHPTIPDRVTGQQPWTVDGFDMLLRLDDPVGDAYAIAAGDLYLTKVEEILRQRGFTQYVINQTAADKTAPTSRAWVFDDQTTWLTIVNDLLASVGYQAVWSDWDGRLRCDPYVLPQQRAAEWTYTDDVRTTMLGVQRTLTRDLTDAPNRWVFYRQNNIDDAPPVEGAGMYTVQNDSVGPTSINARGGR